MRNRAIVGVNFDLRVYPEDFIEVENERLVLADMHGNALKLLFLLIKFKFAKLEAADYLQFRDIYLKENPSPLRSRVLLTSEYISAFDTTLHAVLRAEELVACKAIIDRMLINESAALCLIGDLLADRGKNDVLTLWIIEKLSLAGIDLDIILSNHDLIFIHKVESALANASIVGSLLTPLTYEGVKAEQKSSLDACLESIKLGFISEAEIFRLYSVYKKHLILLGAYEQLAGITITSHAPTGLDVIVETAQLFHLSVSSPGTRHALLSTVQTINTQFRQHVEANSITREVLTLPHMKLGHKSLHPVMKLTWSRAIPGDDQRPPVLADGTIMQYAHGHRPFVPTKPECYRHIHSLDNGPLGFKEDYLTMMNRLQLVGQPIISGANVYVQRDLKNPVNRSIIDAATRRGYFPTGNFSVGDCYFFLVVKDPKPEARDTASAASAASAATGSERAAFVAACGGGSSFFSAASAAKEIVSVATTGKAFTL